MGERLFVPVVCSVFLSLAAVGNADADEGQASGSSGQILTAVQDGKGNHAVLVRSGERMAVLMGKPGQMTALDVVGAQRSGPSFMVDTLQEGLIEFNTRDKAAIIRGDVGFIQRRPTRTFSKSPDKAVVDKVNAMMAPKPAATPAAKPPRGLKGARARVKSRAQTLRPKNKAKANASTATNQQGSTTAATGSRGLTAKKDSGRTRVRLTSTRAGVRAAKAKAKAKPRRIKARGR